AMIRYAAKQTAEYLGIHGFSNLVNLPTRGDLAPRKHISIIFLNIFKALSGDKDAKQFLQNAGISSDTLPGLSQRLYSDWTGADLARLPYDLKEFWVRGEKNIGSVIYHADAYQNVDALTADLSTLTVRPMIKQAGVNDWTWGGQKQAKAPFPYYFLEWAGLDKSLDYNMMVKICAYDYSGDTKCYNTAVKTTKPKASNQGLFW
ncbi:MAG: hypothetical protein LBT91_03405, partial [Bifidobacteriaceae bacterium]|nr:hypothetical protein [Bifidobacteriaceae bacterium]